MWCRVQGTRHRHSSPVVPGSVQPGPPPRNTAEPPWKWAPAPAAWSPCCQWPPAAGRCPPPAQPAAAPPPAPAAAGPQAHPWLQPPLPPPPPSRRLQLRWALPAEWPAPAAACCPALQPPPLLLRRLLQRHSWAQPHPPVMHAPARRPQLPAARPPPAWRAVEGGPAAAWVAPPLLHPHGWQSLPAARAAPAAAQAQPAPAPAAHSRPPPAAARRLVPPATAALPLPRGAEGWRRAGSAGAPARTLPAARRWRCRPPGCPASGAAGPGSASQTPAPFCPRQRPG